MSDPPAYGQSFGPGFLRKVLSLCVRTGLHRRVPGACDPDHFAEGSEGRLVGPRQRLARLVERHGEADPRGWPGLESMDHLVEAEVRRLRTDEAAALREEWGAVREAEVPDAAYVEGEVLEWIGRSRLQRALLGAADLYQRGESAAEIRKYVARAMRESEPASSGRSVPLIATYEERVALWERGEDLAGRVPTGFPKLDLALGSGVRPGEVMYFLAPPKGAKTSALLNVALNAARRRHGVAFFSFEMGAMPMLMRMDRNVARATKQELRADTSGMARAYRGLIAAGAGEVHLWTGSPREAGVVDAVQRHVEDLRREGERVDLVVLDFLNIMGSASGERELRHELAAISREITAAARALGTAVWSAALVKRSAIAKARIRKDDIAEAFEVIAVGDGFVGICASEELVQAGMRSLYVAALRDEADEQFAGTFRVDLDRMVFRSVKDEEAPHGAA